MKETLKYQTPSPKAEQAGAGGKWEINELEQKKTSKFWIFLNKINRITRS